MDALFSEYDVHDIDTELIYIRDVIVQTGVTIGPFSNGDYIEMVMFNWVTGEIQFCEGDTIVYSTKLNLCIKNNNN